MKNNTDQALTPAAILRDEHIDLSSDEDLADDTLEQLIKSKEEAEIFNDLPLFDVAIIHNFIDEWFDTPNLSFDDLQLPISLSVAFNGAIASELAIAQCIVELKHKIDYERLSSRSMCPRSTCKMSKTSRSCCTSSKKPFTRSVKKLEALVSA